MSAVHTVQVEVNVFDDDDNMTPREIAERGWQAVLDLEAPVVRVINVEQQLDTTVDLEEEPEDEEVRQAQAFYAEHGYAEGMTCQKCGSPPEVFHPDGKGEQVGYCGEHEPDDAS